VVRATPPHRQLPPAGRRIRSKSRLPGRSLLPSSTFGRVAAPRSSRTFDRSACPNVRSCARDPPDLGADFPDAFRSLRPGCSPGFLSWGCPKIAPPSFQPGSPRPGEPLGPPSRWECRFPSACRPRGFPPPRRFVPPRPRGRLQAAADPGVQRVSSCRETGFPALHLPPFEAFPPPTATVAGRIRPSVGPRHRSDRRRSSRSPRTLPPRR
jgi:hypothetical protein